MPIKQLLILALILFSLAIRPAPAVRETIVSTDGSAAVLLYFSPDPEPIAHKTVEINLDLQKVINLQDKAVSLVIEDNVGGIKEVVPLSIKDRTATGFFVFPIRGIYRLTFTVIKEEASEGITFISDRRVLRGVHGADSRPSAPFWAKAGLVMSVWVLLVVVVLGINHKKVIYRLRGRKQG